MLTPLRVLTPLIALVALIAADARRPLHNNRTMDFVNAPLLAAAFVVFVSVVAGLFSARIGLSFLLVFLVAGILVGEDGIVGRPFDDFVLTSGSATSRPP